MSARKARPPLGASITPAMSLRDMAAALGVSLAELSRWKALAAIPLEEFEARIAEQKQAYGEVKLVRMFGPVPARGRVQRAVALVAGMTADERRRFLLEIGGIE